MTTFPDMVVRMDGINLDGSHAVYRWTSTGRTLVQVERQYRTYQWVRGMDYQREGSDSGVEGTLR